MEIFGIASQIKIQLLIPSGRVCVEELCTALQLVTVFVIGIAGHNKEPF